MSNGNLNPDHPKPYVFEQLRRLTDAFPRTRFGDGNMREYANNLARFGPETLPRAISQVIAGCKFFPSIAEISQATENPRERGDSGGSSGLVVSDDMRALLMHQDGHLNGMTGAHWQWPAGAKTWAEVREFQAGAVGPPARRLEGDNGS